MCPAGWEPRPSHFADLDVSPFACECSCPDVAVPTCEYLVTFYSGTGCDGDPLASQFVEQGDCPAYLGSDAHSVHVQDITNVVDCGTPAFEPPAASTWGTRLDVCVPEVGEACSIGDCVPAPPPPLDGELCVFQSGDVQCPADSAFQVRHLVYVGYDDQRECACSCFTTQASCGGTLVAYTDNVCGNFAGSTNASIGCAAELDDVNSANIGGGAPVAACQPFNDLTPSGEVTPAGPTTFCCTTP
jgi:hypothetical protein